MKEVRTHFLMIFHTVKPQLLHSTFIPPASCRGKKPCNGVDGWLGTMEPIESPSQKNEVCHKSCVICRRRRNGELWCDSLTNNPWQDPGCHKDRSVALYLWSNEQIRAVCVCPSVCVCVFLSYLSSGVWLLAILPYSQKYPASLDLLLHTDKYILQRTEGGWL